MFSVSRLRGNLRGVARQPAARLRISLILSRCLKRISTYKKYKKLFIVKNRYTRERAMLSLGLVIFAIQFSLDFHVKSPQRRGVLESFSPSMAACLLSFLLPPSSPFFLSACWPSLAMDAKASGTHQQPCSQSQRSASIAAIAPVPAEVMAWR